MLKPEPRAAAAACPMCKGAGAVPAPTKNDPLRVVSCGTCGGSGKSTAGYRTK